MDAAHVLGIGDPVVTALHQRHDLVVRLPKQLPRLAEEGAAGGRGRGGEEGQGEGARTWREAPRSSRVDSRSGGFCIVEDVILAPFPTLSHPRTGEGGGSGIEAPLAQEAGLEKERQPKTRS